MKKTYYAAREGFIENLYRKVGDPVGPLSEDQAKYLLLSGHLSETKPAAPATASLKKSSKPAEADKGKGED